MRGLLAVLVVAVGYGAWVAFSVWLSFRSIDRVSAASEAASERLTAIPAAERLAAPAEAWARDRLPPYDLTLATSPALPDEQFHAFLIIGSDSRVGRFADSQADVILLVLFPSDGSSPLMVSIPRDLYLPNPCYATLTRINYALHGCGEYANGPQLLSSMVTTFTGIRPDHFVLVGLEDFVRVIDTLGGYQICPEYPVRDIIGTGINFPAGCSLIGGQDTLWWIRSRHLEQFVDGEWQPVPGTSDLDRNQHQQEVLLAMLGKLKSFRSITSLASLADSLADAVTIDDQSSMTDMIRLAWGMRDLDAASIQRFTIPLTRFVATGGAKVLLPEASFADVLADAGVDTSP